MAFDFSKPQHQSVKGIAIMFVDTLQNIIRGLWVPLLLILYKFDWSKMVFFGIGVFVILLVIGIIAYLQYKNFTFFLDEEKEEFVIQKGVITKNKITIQLDKIQQVNINQSVIQKLVGVFSVDIDTAGSNKKEASIRAVDNEIALHLKNRLLSFEKITETEKTEDDREEVQKPFLKISFLTLVKVGITSNYGRSIALILGFIGSLYGGFSDVAYSLEVNEQQVTGLVEQGFNYFSFSFFLLLGLTLILVINLVRTIVKNFDYQMVLQKKALAITYGLFAKKNTLLKPEKVQITAYSQNFFQRKLNLFDLKMKQASSTDEAEKDAKKSDIEVPGCNNMEREAILKMILKDLPQTEEVINPNYRYLIMTVLFGIIIPSTIFISLGVSVFEILQPYFPFVLVYVLFMAIVLFFKFKNYRLKLSHKFIVIKSNAWDIEHQLLQPFKIQGITTKQFFWHKKADVVHITFHTAAGDVAFKFANFSLLKPWINYWLYEVERTERSWM
ncbi:PH domain-containing protein [Flavobacterium sp.]|jgi:putative membrane protein|uniref:PH domain-containing protein n=1 Tax=Flavobacterium sp. TaxID=239 RepID=UPI0037BFC440